MRTILSILVCVLFGAFGLQSQECPNLISPYDGEEGVPVDAPIYWEDVDHPNFVGYLISLGTTPGGEDILKKRSAGVTSEFISPIGLPDDTTIYVTISMFIAGQDQVVCSSQSFSTSDVVTPPDCTELNTTVTPPPSIRGTFISWFYAYTATGYYLTVGTTEGGNEILDNLDVGNQLSFEILPALPEDTEIFVRVTPYNENGEATNCNSENFLSLAVTADVCSSYYSASQGGVIYPSPQLTFPDKVFICTSDPERRFKVQDQADGARWFYIDQSGEETLVSSDLDVKFEQPGQYRLEAFNDLVTAVSTIECASSKTFSVYVSEKPEIIAVDVEGDPENRKAIISVAGNGDYEFSLEEFGEYRSFREFNGLGPAEQKIYVRDRNGCGTSIAVVPKVLSAADFPAFFTPNNDSSNDNWAFNPRDRKIAALVERIRIYDRYGRLLTMLMPDSKGWDGTYNGQLLPPSDYWFIAETISGDTIKGHFTLKQ